MTRSEIKAEIKRLEKELEEKVRNFELSYEDSDGDELVVEKAHSRSSNELFVHTSANGMYLTIPQLKHMVAEIQDWIKVHEQT